MIDIDKTEALAKSGYWSKEHGPEETVSIIAELCAEMRALREYQDKARKQVYELMGIVADIEQFGSGFDDACMNTIKRVMTALLVKEQP